MRSTRVLLASVLLSAAAAAQTTPRLLQQLPAEADGVAIFPRPQRLQERWAALAGLFGGKGGFLDLAAETGLDSARLGNGPVAKVGFPKAGGAESWAWVLPATRAKELLPAKAKAVPAGWTWSIPAKAGGKGSKPAPPVVLHAGVRPGWLVVASSPAALEQVVKAKGSLAGELAPFATWIDGHDAAFVTTRAGAARAAQEAADALHKKPGLAAPAAVAEGEAPKPPAPKAPRRLQARLEVWAELARTSLDRILAGLELTDGGGVRIEAKALLLPGSPLARELEGLAPVAGHPLGGLPAEGFALALGGGWSGLFDLQAAVVDDLDPDGKVGAAARARLQAALEAQNRQIRSWGVTLAAPAAGQPLLGGLRAVLRVEDSRAYLAAMEETGRAQAAFLEGLGMAEAVTFHKDVLPGVPSASMSLRLEGKADDPAAMQLRQGMGMLLGGEAIQSAVAALDEHRLLWTVGGADSLKAQLEEARKATGGLPPSIAAVEPDLGSAHRFALYLDLRGLRALAEPLAAMFAGPEAKPLPEIPETPAAGLVLHLDPAAIELRGSVRGETLRAAAAFAKAVKTMFPDKKPAQAPAKP